MPDEPDFPPVVYATSTVSLADALPAATATVDDAPPDAAAILAALGRLSGDGE